MRTIKFRGKKISTGEWVYGDLYQYQSNQYISDEIIVHPTYSDPSGEWIFREHQVIPETVGQFTGLFDSTGAEIYEGDKVHSKMSRYLGTEKCHIVEWGDCKFVAKGYNGSIEVKPILNFRTDWEVIGNIHDKTSDQ